MKNPILFTLIICVIIFISCDSNHNVVNPNDNSTTIVGSGTVTSETHILPAFHTVVLTGTGNIHIYSGDEQFVGVDADDNVHEYIELSVTGGILTIATKDNISFSNVSIDYYLTMTDLQKISVIGAGNVSIISGFEADQVTLELIGAGDFHVNLNVDDLTTNLIGSGNFIIQGTANRHKILLSGVGNIGNFNLVTTSSDIVLSGVGNIYANVDETLNGTITGVGSIFYRGSPALNVTITGIGSVINAN